MRVATTPVLTAPVAGWPSAFRERWEAPELLAKFLGGAGKTWTPSAH
jgi:hypothetical protein